MPRSECYEIDDVECGLLDIFSTGEMKIEPVGPTHARIIWYVQKRSARGHDFQVPVASIIVPSTAVLPTASKLAAAHALAIADFVGQPRGTA